MKVRMTRFWRGHQPDTVLDLERGVADIYVNVRKVAVFIGDDEPEEEKPAVEYMVPQLGGVRTTKAKRQV